MKQALLKHALVDLFQWARNTANMRTAGEGSEAHELDQAEPGPSDHDEHITLVADDGANYAFSELAAALHAHDFLHTALRLKLCDTCIAFKTVRGQRTSCALKKMISECPGAPEDTDAVSSALALHHFFLYLFLFFPRKSSRSGAQRLSGALPAHHWQHTPAALACWHPVCRSFPPRSGQTHLQPTQQAPRMTVHVKLELSLISANPQHNLSRCPG